MVSKEEYPKEEFYKNFIEMQKRTGQGTSGIVKVQGGSTICEYLDEFIKEGLVVMMETGGSLGHPESNRFYMPTKGYNVWKEKNTMSALECVRYYIQGEKYMGDPFFGINKDTFKEGGEMYEYYTDWLQRNQVELDEMMNLSDIYPGVETI